MNVHRTRWNHLAYGLGLLALCACSNDNDTPISVDPEEQENSTSTTFTYQLQATSAQTSTRVGFDDYSSTYQVSWENKDALAVFNLSTEQSDKNPICFTALDSDGSHVQTTFQATSTGILEDRLMVFYPASLAGKSIGTFNQLVFRMLPSVQHGDNDYTHLALNQWMIGYSSLDSSVTTHPDSIVTLPPTTLKGINALWSGAFTCTDAIAPKTLSLILDEGTFYDGVHIDAETGTVTPEETLAVQRLDFSVDGIEATNAFKINQNIIPTDLSGHQIAIELVTTDDNLYLATIDGQKLESNGCYTDDIALVRAPQPGDSEDNPLWISTFQELKEFATNVNSGRTKYDGKYIKLQNDITLSGEWTPIGLNGTKHFAGHFDGNGKTISGLSITKGAGKSKYGFFGWLQNATIKDLTVEGSIDFIAKNTGFDVGGVIGQATNCTLHGTICSNVSIQVSGMVGSVGGVIGNLIHLNYDEDTHLINKGDILWTASSVNANICRGGGVLGNLTKIITHADEATFDVTNHGNLSITKDGTVKVFGIMAGGCVGNTTLDNVTGDWNAGTWTNTASISVVSPLNASVGGIVGLQQTGAAVSPSAYVSTGNLSATSTANTVAANKFAATGGFMGISFGSQDLSVAIPATLNYNAGFTAQEGQTLEAIGANVTRIINGVEITE